MGSDPAQQSQANGLNYTEMGDILQYEHVPGKFTYTLGDATAAYTRKIDCFQRPLAKDLVSNNNRYGSG